MNTISLFDCEDITTRTRILKDKTFVRELVIKTKDHNIEIDIYSNNKLKIIED